MDWKAEIAAAAERSTAYVQRTPVMRSAVLWEHPVDLKLEHLQHTGSFKARGAFNTLLSLPVPGAGVVAASGGNHGAAVAYAATRLGYRAQIFVPEIAGTAKIALIERTGAALTVVPGEYANALEQARAYEAETGAMQVHAYDAVPTLAGQGTLMREWEQQGLAADTVLIAVGGGGLIGGALGWLQGARRVVAVEPQQARTLDAALQAGAPVDVEVSGVAANALGARRIGSLCFGLAQRHLARRVTVTDAAIVEAQRALWQAHRLLVEPAGATALAALRSGY
uniref:Threonine dehydratase n=1 Tax=Alloyangia mangrovi TaxID=1779329 RepID=A0A2A3JYD1_9RHOB